MVADPGDDGAVGDAGDGNVEVTGQAVVLIAVDDQVGDVALQ